MALCAILTAGGRLPRQLRRYSASPIKALLEFDGRSLLETAAAAARDCGLVERIAAVGGADVQAAVHRLNRWRAGERPLLEWVAQGAGVMDNIYNGFLHLDGERHEYLLLSPDLPFLSAAALREFIGAARREAEFSAPLVSAEDFLARFPGAPNAFARLDGRRVTMGSVMFMTGKALKTNIPLGRDFYACRKFPHRLAALLGLPILWCYLTGRLSLAAVERRAEALMGVSVRGVWVHDAGIAYDVDNRANYDYALRMLGLERRDQGAGNRDQEAGTRDEESGNRE